MRKVLIVTLVADSSILPESKGRQHRRGFRRQRTEEDSAAGGTAGQFNSFVEISTDFSTDFSTEFL